MKEINIKEIKDFKIGHAGSTEGATGCTAVICPDGAVAGCDIRGGGPASRETPLLDPVKNAQAIHCVMLSGGSAFGLAAGDGAMSYLEEHKIGYELGPFIVPLVCGASIFDLAVGTPGIRPDKEMGYAACEDAYSPSSSDELPTGNVGAGTGATVGKMNGPLHAMKTGLGTYAVEIDGVKIGAIAVVNALGDIIENGKIIAGTRNADNSFADSNMLIKERLFSDAMIMRDNTTLVCLITDANITKSQANKVAQVMHNGLAMAISPVHTAADGDSTFCMASGKKDVNPDALAQIAAQITQKAIINAAKSAEGACGIPAERDLR